MKDNKIDWKRKLTSRKFWLAIASFVSMLIMASGGTDNQSAQAVALIMAGATVVAYIFGEGFADGQSAGVPDPDVLITEELTGEPDTDDGK